MNTIPTDVAGNVPILASDLGKHKSVACIFRSPDDVRYQRADDAGRTTPADREAPARGG